MPKLNAYFHFDGNCREAMNFYKAAFGGELSVMTMGESPMAKEMSAEEKKKVMHARLTHNGLVIMADDMRPKDVKAGGPISLSVVSENKKEVDALFSKLSAGGKALHAPKDEFFGYYGDLTDKYGISWMLVFETPRS